VLLISDGGDPGDLDRMLGYITDHDFVSGSRMSGQESASDQSEHAFAWMSFAVAKLIQSVWGGGSLRDVFPRSILLRKAAAGRISPHLREPKGTPVCSEILFAAIEERLAMVQVPVAHVPPAKGSMVSVLRMAGIALHRGLDWTATEARKEAQVSDARASHT
jgi:hypothetical protein